MFSINAVQELVISHAMSNFSTFTVLKDINEIREISWAGTAFTYPNYRVGDFVIVPDMERCNRADGTFKIMAFTNDKSSLNCDTMNKEIADLFHGKQAANSVVRCKFYCTSMIQAKRFNEIWYGVTSFKVMIQGA